MAEKIKVWPTSDKIRAKIYHPIGNVRFPADKTMPALWPRDKFTLRRLRDGDITVTDPLSHSEEKETEAAHPAAAHHPSRPQPQHRSK